MDMEVISLFFGVFGFLITVTFFATVCFWKKNTELEKGGMRETTKLTMPEYFNILRADQRYVDLVNELGLS